MNITIKYELFGSHSGDDENFIILVCDTRLAGSFRCANGMYYLRNCALLCYYVATSGNF